MQRPSDASMWNAVVEIFLKSPFRLCALLGLENLGLENRSRRCVLLAPVCYTYRTVYILHELIHSNNSRRDHHTFKIWSDWFTVRVRVARIGSALRLVLLVSYTLRVNH